MKRTREAERGPWARLTGAMYLAYFLTTIGTTLVQSRLPKAIGIAGNLLAYLLYAITTLLFYDLFKPVNRRLSLVAALVSLAGCLVGSLAIFDLPTYHVNVLVFFGPYGLLLGTLILGSTFLPRILGALMVLAGLGWLAFLIPALAKHMGTGIEVLGVAAEGIVDAMAAGDGCERAAVAEASRGAGEGRRVRGFRGCCVPVRWQEVTAASTTHGELLSRMRAKPCRNRLGVRCVDSGEKLVNNAARLPHRTMRWGSLRSDSTCKCRAAEA